MDIETIIIAKLNRELLSHEEEMLFNQWYSQPENRKRYYELQKLQAAIYANSQSSEIRTEKAWQKVSQQRHSFILSDLRKYAAVAVLLIITGIAFYWSKSTQQTIPVVENIMVVPGNKQAILTLSNGQKISLSDSLHRIVSKENGIIIRNNAPNMLVYDKSEESEKTAYNTISIPRGGEYKLTLSDGTTVWLNSESRLTFPVAFNGHTRELQVEGEAYFEVTKDTSRPFIVHTRQFDIRVTGTEFNVRTYPDEPESATLAEGSIQLEKGNEIYRLQPGQQAVAGQEVIIREVNIEEAIAWRNEAFCFKQSRLETIMNELARWYDIDIFYLNPGLKDLHFTAWFHRGSTISEVIKILEKTQKIKLELQGKTLTVQTK